MRKHPLFAGTASLLFAVLAIVPLRVQAGNGTGATHVQLNLLPCKPGSPAGAPLCGDLRVPENWSHPNGRSIALHVVVVPALQPDKNSVPLFDIEGGPGVGSSVAAPAYMTDLSIHRQHRDVVMMDQRGTGGSNALHCPEIEKADPLSPFDYAAAASRCRLSLEHDTDLTQYGTLAAARDLEEVRAALGAPKIDIAALSYGTALSQVYMRLYPEHVHAIVLFGSLPLDEKMPLHHAPNAQAALDEVFSDCRADPACVKAYPNLQSEWPALLALLDSGAVKVPGPHGPFVLNRGPFAEALRNRMAMPAGERSLPYLIHAAAMGNFAPYLAAVAKTGPEPEAEGLYLSVACPEGTNRITPEEVQRESAGTFLGEYRVRLQMGECAAWVKPTPDPAVLEPIHSDLPVLLFAGDRDATTSPAWADEIARGLPNARVIHVAAMTHFPDGLSDMGCLDRIAIQFFAAGSAQHLDTACIAGMKPPPFYVASSKK